MPASEQDCLTSAQRLLPDGKIQHNPVRYSVLGKNVVKTAVRSEQTVPTSKICREYSLDNRQY